MHDSTLPAPLEREGGRPSVTLVTEAYNLAEGQSKASFLRALQTVLGICRRYPGVEVIVLDPTHEHVAGPILSAQFPQLKALHVPGKTYDGQKNAAARAAQGEFLVFLDGDCVPQSDDWLEVILQPFARPDVHAVGGLTIYEGDDVTSQAMTVMDFGFLFEPDAEGLLGCYASNNVAFRLSTYLNVMAPDDGVMRSYCYKHAQLLARAGTPVHAHHAARVFHELPDVRKERLRRGYDHAAALWEDPVLEGAARIALDEAFISSVLKEQADLAFARLKNAPAFLGVGPDREESVRQEIARLLELDRQGLVEALERGEADGANARARAAHAAEVARVAPTRRGVGRRLLERFRFISAN